MIGTIQRNIKKLTFILWIIVAAFIGTIFLVWGRGSFMGTSNYVAKVGKVEITLSEFQRAYSRILDFYRNTLKDKFTPEVAKQFNIKEQALATLINKALILHAARKEGIHVAPEEVVEAIESIPAFKVNGVFNKKRYVEVLKLNGYSPVEFERELYNDIMRKKLESTVKLSVVLNDLEVKEFITWMLEKGKIKYFAANVLDFAPMVTVNDAELVDFYKNHKEMFRTKPILTFVYTVVSPESFKDKVLVTKEEVEQYYKENQDEFIDEKGNLKPLDKVKSQIIKELKEEKARKEALRLIKKVLLDVEKGVDFEKACKDRGLKIFKEESVTENKSKAPDVVFKAALDLKPGKVSDIIKGKDTFYLVKLINIIPSRIPEFSEIRWKVEQLVKEEKAPEAAARWAANFIKNIKGSLEEAVKKAGLKYKVKESGYFTRSSGLRAGKLIFRKLPRVALDKKPKEVGYVIENSFLVVFVLEEKIKPTDEEIRKAADRMKPFLLDRKREEVWNQFLKDLRERVEIKLNQRLWEAIK